MIETSDRIGDVVEVDHLFVDRMFNSRAKSARTDDRTHIEKGPSDRRHPNTTGPLHHIHIVDSPTTMHDDTVKLRTYPVWNKHMNSRIGHPTKTPFLTSRREGQGCQRITQTCRNFQLIAAHRPCR